MPAQHMTLFRYPPQDGSRLIEIDAPTWPQVREAVERLDDQEFPIVQLDANAADSCVDIEGAFNVFGGRGSGYAVFENMGVWRFLWPEGSDEEVRLWQSDQGYFCERRALLTDLGDVLELAEAYFNTGSYAAVVDVASRLLSRPAKPRSS
ncbi:hypothetical protein DMC25_08320 [Caulobacter sp. D4A]|uniref:hypothetical protein n=1 Tax=Caulobacter sp. D4A TaxID=2204171 RepID=UPI000D727368|nr:hypothetical protein [Caulobacter sp. D4A]PXA90212.1 hypothetical protein DMC25_08320 [Caulobacter sp. D4A]